jgi:peptidyl-prolyl cis-trans isomerase SurA
VVAGALLAAAFLCGSLPNDASAVIVERVVAVVGERPILLSELRHRARPELVRIAMQAQNPAQLAGAETEVYRNVLNRMIDDRLEESAADKARISVTSEEIDNALREVAARARITPADLVAEARRMGLSEQDYRDELRRQLLEGKLVQLRVRGRVRVTDQEGRAAYQQLLREMGEDKLAELRILALRIAPGSTIEQVRERTALASEIVERARGGEDFCALVTTYSDDVQTKETCGSRGPQPTSALLGPLQDAVRGLRSGEVSEPIAFGTEAILVVQLADEPRVPTYDEVRETMLNRAFQDAVQRQLKSWLQELRRGVYVDVRL